jgi:predicted ribosome quality control (RQC) complex YloA/Tae2 family protein
LLLFYSIDKKRQERDTLRRVKSRESQENYCTMSKKSAKQAEKLLQDIRKIARLDGNKQCVDCPEKVI